MAFWCSSHVDPTKMATVPRSKASPKMADPTKTLPRVPENGAANAVALATVNSTLVKEKPAPGKNRQETLTPRRNKNNAPLHTHKETKRNNGAKGKPVTKCRKRPPEKQGEPRSQTSKLRAASERDPPIGLPPLRSSGHCEMCTVMKMCTGMKRRLARHHKGLPAAQIGPPRKQIEIRGSSDSGSSPFPCECHSASAHSGT
ncbi:Hypothetical predicted protein [Podarcis lilfordi]|uniref:Uncharacterized protein n=1 Tax=Podarcis lilfordi TaxID=74358 RepID=A0AA35P7E7_9SAUR|nr:Hypothetical predicted protein [Podarcis lilfordi]